MSREPAVRRAPKVEHEIRCPVHGFIRFTNLERDLIDSAPVQRLKHIHQLAMTYQVYPGATHRRFEHSLGVMDLAGRAFDSLMQDGKREYGAGALPEAMDRGQREYWRGVLRLAALLHDVGHLPFSHAAEKQLLPDGWSHETLTRKLILESEIADILHRERPQYRPEDVAKLALDPDQQPEPLGPWEGLLNRLITGGTFGVDRMDYLLRDSHHAGVPYGRFDPLRLLDNLVIIEPPEPPADGGAAAGNGFGGGGSTERLQVGVQEGGVYGVAALLVARYFMYTQLYFHDVRRAYDLHLIDFLKAHYPGRSYPTELSKHLAQTDNGVVDALRGAAEDPGHPGHEPARRIQQRAHFRTAYRFKKADFPQAGEAAVIERVRRKLEASFGAANVRVDSYFPEQETQDVFVLSDDGEVVSGRFEFDLLARIPPAWFAYVLCDAQLTDKVLGVVRSEISNSDSQEPSP